MAGKQQKVKQKHPLWANPTEVEFTSCYQHTILFLFKKYYCLLTGSNSQNGGFIAQKAGFVVLAQQWSRPWQ